MLIVTLLESILTLIVSQVALLDEIVTLIVRSSIKLTGMKLPVVLYLYEPTCEKNQWSSKMLPVRSYSVKVFGLG